MLLGVDVGGTFTDAVLAVDERLFTAKAPTTPADQSEGVLAAVRAVLARAGRAPEEVREFFHGMTVATNALLEGRVARTALIATEGFTDLIELGRQNRPELYRLCAARPAPLVPDELRFGAPERMTPDGPLIPLTPSAAGRLASQVREAGVEAVAVVLLHSYSHPEHERRLGDALGEEQVEAQGEPLAKGAFDASGEALAQGPGEAPGEAPAKGPLDAGEALAEGAGEAPGHALPKVHVSLSHEVVGTFREYERAATTEIDAALSPLLASYLRSLVDRCEGAGLPAPSIMQSNGGLIDAEAAAGHASWTILSGPAGGAAGAAFVARAAGEPRALCFDMGGTSCDVCVVDDGAVQEQSVGEVAGRPLALPMLAVHTVGAGGGSIAWRDPGGALRVGPRSAGADPGPACYGRGGTEPTVTDANLLLGYLSRDSPLAGGVRLDVGAAERAVGALADSLGLRLLECAEGIRRVAGAEMVRALRVVTVERGVDPRSYALIAFGGAGPLHAAQIADELEIDTILCPRASGVLAALGLVVSQRRRDVQRSVLLSGEAITAEAVAGVVAELGERARRALGGDLGEPARRALGADDGAQARRTLEADVGGRARRALGAPRAELHATYELRYQGQSFELPVAAELDASPQELRAAFEAAHEERYGYRDADQALELVTVRVTATTAGADVRLEAAGAVAEPARSRRATPGGELDVLHGPPPPGASIRGPAVIELPESTVLVPREWSGGVDRSGTIKLERTR